MYTDNKHIIQLISLLKQFEIKKVVISPGSRHYPLTHSLESDTYFQLHSVVDERSAAFYALGLIQQSNEPVAICCSSGTASVNYSSAVCEAFYQELPLLVITIDRLPALLNQTEDQMIRQTNIYDGFVKYSCSLPPTFSELDVWHSNRVINEALIHLNKNGKGPVHINIPIAQHHNAQFPTKELPKVRRIHYHSAEMEAEQWEQLGKYLKGKRVLVVWGQSVDYTARFKQALDRLSEKLNFVIVTDRISNCHHPKAIINTFLALRVMSIGDQNELAPDIVISVGGNFVFNLEIKGFLAAYKTELENWCVNKGGDIRDPYRRLTRVFEMNPDYFFDQIANYAPESEDTNSYLEGWQAVLSKVTPPNIPFCQLKVVGEFLNRIPEESVLQIANSNAIRFAHLFDFNHSVKCYCNRGVNGIDGSMSTAVGYGAGTDKAIFYLTGDLTFFYDMNALWNRQLSKNMRILLVNNEGGAVMHMPFGEDKAKELERYTSARHELSAKGWAESLGFEYHAIQTEEEVPDALNALTDISSEKRVFVEVFTHKEHDVKIVKEYYAQLNNVTTVDRAKRKLLRMAKQYIKR